MKNLKKVLALVLVVASLMGLAATASAKDYTDGDKIVNTEAVDVMSATKVIAGMPDGSFNPAGNVTRAQMAKIVSAVLNGGEDIGNMYASANVFSDCTSHWAKSYIAYASNMKIVSGVGNGKFNPEGNVTGVAAAKMFLVALGYDPAIEVYTGKDWVANVMADAKDAGLLKGMPKNFDYSAPLSRDNSALMAVNAMQATVVEYTTKGTDINIGDTSINVGASKATAKTTSDLWGGYFGDAAVSGKYDIQLGEQCFDNLKITKPGDVFGRLAKTWTYDRKEIGTYADAPTLSYTKGVKAGDIYKDLGKITLGASDVATLTVDGYQTSSNIKGQLVANNATVYGGNGALTEVYLTTAANGDKTVTVTVINTYLGKVGSFVAAKDDDKAYITVSTAGGSAPNGTLAGTPAGKFETNAFTKADKDAYVLYTAASETGAAGSYEVIEVVKAETVRGKFTAYSSSKNTVTVDGKVYDISSKTADTISSYLVSGALKDTVDLYLDADGYVIGMKQYSAESKDLAVVLGFKAESGFGSSATNSVQLLLADGTVKVFGLGTNKGSVAVGGGSYTPTGGSAIVIGDVVTYTDDGDNVFKLAKKNNVNPNTGAADAAYGSTALAASTALKIAKGNNAIDLDSATPATTDYYANSATIYLLHTAPVGGTETFEAYVGYANVPGLTGKASTEVTVYVTDGVASVVYVKNAEVSTASSNLVFVSGKSYGIGGDADLGSIKTYQAVVDGKIVEEFRISTTATATNGAIVDGTAGHMLSGYGSNSKGVVTSYTTAASTDFVAASGIKAAKNDVVTIGSVSKAYTKDVKVFYADKDGKLTDIGIDGISEDLNDDVFYTMKDGVITNIYIVYKADV